MSVVSYHIENKIGLISLDNPPVNALSHALRKALVQVINQAQGDESQALVILCQGRTFIAGADLSEFGKPQQDPTLAQLIETIESSKKPIIAAIHGYALGGGLEVAMACHYRCALKSAKLGLPEVNLGLLPGGGGTQRLPRLVGVETALDIITKGAPMTNEKALTIGLIDRIIDGDLQQQALAYANELVTQQAPLVLARHQVIATSDTLNELFASTRQKLAKKAKGQLAPQLIVDCVEAATTLPFEQGLSVERDKFSQCLQSPQSSAMRHLFFAQRQAAKVQDLDKNTPTRPIASVAIIGAGTMGGGIAMNFANAGINVTLLELDNEALSRGLAAISKNYQFSVKRNSLSATQVEQRLALISGSTDYQDLSEVDLVIEAVFEDLTVKQQVFAKLDEVCKAGAILATNTSYQDVNLIAGATKRPQDVIGLHFFSPANVMKLLEVVRGKDTCDEVIATAMRLATKIGKIPVLANVCYGFIGNRMLTHYVRESQMLLLEGATPSQVDQVICDWGMAMGPLAMGDLAGLDIGYKARQARSDLPNDIKYCHIANQLVAMGRLGQKTGAGFYRYDEQTRQRHEDAVVLDLIKQQASELGVVQREISSEEIVRRLIYPLINEGAHILEQGIAQRPSDIDVVYCFGYGFGKTLGGPMFYADQVGLKTIYQQMCQLRDRDPSDKFNQIYWQPAPLLEQLASQGSTFAQWQQQRVTCEA